VQELVERLSGGLEAFGSDEPSVVGFDLGDDATGGTRRFPASVVVGLISMHRSAHIGPGVATAG
jgi:hypothetical protein